MLLFIAKLVNKRNKKKNMGKLWIMNCVFNIVNCYQITKMKFDELECK